jgi:ribonuclease P/MRP protein subunit POP5
MKLKGLLPSLREKKRYIAFSIKSADDISFKEAKNGIEGSMLKFIGELGVANAGPLFLKDWKNMKGIIKVNTKYVDHTKASIALIKEINGKKAKVESIGVSGVLSKIRSSHF